MEDLEPILSELKGITASVGELKVDVAILREHTVRVDSEIQDIKRFQDDLVKNESETHQRLVNRLYAGAGALAIATISGIIGWISKH